MLNLKGILTAIIAITLLYIIVYYWILTPSVLTHLAPATQAQTIKSSSLSTSSNAQDATNFTYSIWFYIEDWNYRYGDDKILMTRMSPASKEDSNVAEGIYGKNPCPAVILSKYENNLEIYQSVFGSSEPTVHRCRVQNIPIQRWVNLIVSVYGRTMDVYLDGKLIKTCMMEGPAHISSKEDLYITPMGGFSGWTSYCQYFNDATDPNTAWSIYKKGFGGSPLGSLINYQVKIDIEKNGIPKKSFTI